MAKRINLNKEYLSELYKNNHGSITQMSKQTGISQYVISRELKKHDFNIISSKNVPKKKRKSHIRIKITKDEFLKLHYKEHMSIKEIASKIKCHPDSLSRVVRTKFRIDIISYTNYIKSCINLKSQGFTPNSLLEYKISNNYSMKQISEITNVSVNSLNRFIKEYGLSLSQRKVPESDFEKIKTMYNSNIRIEDIASVYNVNKHAIYNILYKTGIKLRHNVSFGEKQLSKFIDSYYEIIENSRDIIYPFELDIFVPELNIAFEFNGLYWHSDKFKNKDYHKHKTELCHEKGIQLIHIFEDEWFSNGNIKNTIKNKLKKQKSIYARECNLGIYQDKDSMFGYSLSYKGKTVYTMSFSGSNGKYNININSDVRVIGGFSKLLKESIKLNDIKEITAKVDRRFSTENNVFSKHGFLLDHVTEPERYNHPNLIIYDSGYYIFKWSSK